MARRKHQTPEAVVDDYAAAKLVRSLSVGLAIPDDPTMIRRCADALKRGRRKAARAKDWPGRVAALEEAAAGVFGADYVERARREAESREPAGDPVRREMFVRAIEASMGR